jgi:hypothetical protein
MILEMTVVAAMEVTAAAHLFAPSVVRTAGGVVNLSFAEAAPTAPADADLHNVGGEILPLADMGAGCGGVAGAVAGRAPAGGGLFGWHAS